MAKKTSQGLKDRLREAELSERAAILDGQPYDVGFGKPPVRTRFSADHQPRRRGRPKGSENIDRILREELAAPIVVIEDGKRRSRSRQRVIVKQIGNQVATGNLKAAALWFDLLRKNGLLQPDQSGDAPALDARDIATMANIVEAYRATGPADAKPPGNGEEDR